MGSTKKTTGLEPIKRLLNGSATNDDALPSVDYEQWHRQMEAEARERSNQIARDNRERARKKRMEKLFGHAGIPPRFQDKGFENFRSHGEDQYRAVMTCRAFADRFEDVQSNGGCLILIGRPGTGKTHLACAIARIVIEKGHTALFTSVAELMRQVRDGYRGEETESRVLRRFTEPTLLVLDEVGIGVGREETRHAILMDVINRRYENMKPTILIGNLTADEMRSHLGDRIWRRVAEEECSAIVPFTWSRQKAASE